MLEAGAVTVTVVVTGGGAPQGVATARTAREAMVRPRANIASKEVEVGELRVDERCREAGFVCCSTGQQ